MRTSSLSWLRVERGVEAMWNVPDTWAVGGTVVQTLARKKDEPCCAVK